ncbi:hypothetical protein CJU90_1543 [Yarrowia sp. C11]|nr:hypothetical protein CKK34_0267 [Yarrowia sp. E02]KAG5371509.1 hypothetical protein CJU90_1543 [Yarrowia sp. C11]
MTSINDKNEWTLLVESLGDHELRAERDRLTNSIQHLKRSNEELQEFVADDPELQEVIDDNTKVVGNQEMRIEVLKAEIAKRGISQEETGDSGPKIEEVVEDYAGALNTNDSANVSDVAGTRTGNNGAGAGDNETVIHL